MLKYWLIIILNTPFVFYGIGRSLKAYRQGITTKWSFFLNVCFWLIIFVGLLFAQPLYESLQKVGLTDSTPLSIFDIVLTTGIIFCLVFISRLYQKHDLLETRTNQLNRELSIQKLKEKESPSGDQ